MQLWDLILELTVREANVGETCEVELLTYDKEGNEVILSIDEVRTSYKKPKIKLVSYKNRKTKSHRKRK